MNPIVYAIPVFFVLMALEWAVAHARQQRVYRLGDTIASVGLGAVSQVSGLYSKAISFGIYVLVAQHLAPLQLPTDAWWVWVVGLILYDFLYYWNHRIGHEVSLFWAAHVVHHQSEDFNLGTALRQSSSGFVAGWIFYLPMALLGFPPLVFAVVALIDLLYQYWIHTEQIGRLGWFDRVFASPSNHRVHHGVNQRYLDKNYGGILILWDRIFGTFEEERDDDPVVYGTRKPLRSHDPIWANLEVYAALARDSWRTRKLADKFRVWLKPPGWRPPDLAAQEPAPSFDIKAVRKYDPPLSMPASTYAGMLFVLLVAAGTHVLALGGADLVRGDLKVSGALYAAWVVLSLWALGRWTEQRRGSPVLLAFVLAAGGVELWPGSVLLALLPLALAIGAMAIPVRPAVRGGLATH
ncbi:MAG TPA: sterol desaturase family protein [Xanthomonadales bacterium]|nr:sterol desaturase family protein [Xanthomonadales bacterium]